jgi:hypothetical protein
MAQKNLGIQDGSNDRRYFTIIPNFTLNHSTLWDREVYVQMKRIAGEDGTCWTSQKTLSKQCGMSINRLKKSLSYLVEHKWIKFIGTKKVGTTGGNQEVNEYRICDLWKINTDYYQDKGVSLEDIPLSKGVSPNEQKGYHENTKGVSPGDDKEEPIKNITIKEDTKVETFGKEVNDIIELFKDINPSYRELYKRKNQRDAVHRLLLAIGEEKVRSAISYLPQTNSMPFSPTITTPIQLEEKIGTLRAFVQKEIIRKNNSKVIIIK